MTNLEMCDAAVEIDEDELRIALCQYMAFAAAVQHRASRVYVEPGETECTLQVNGQEIPVIVNRVVINALGDVILVILADEEVDEGSVVVGKYYFVEEVDGYLVPRQEVGTCRSSRGYPNLVPIGFRVAQKQDS